MFDWGWLPIAALKAPYAKDNIHWHVKRMEAADVHYNATKQTQARSITRQSIRAAAARPCRSGTCSECYEKTMGERSDGVDVQQALTVATGATVAGKNTKELL